MNESRLPSATDLRAAFLACLRAHDACEAAVAHALRAEDGDRVNERVGTLLDCADVCRTTARQIRYGSPLLRGTAGVAAELCARAAEACAAAALPALAVHAEACRRAAACCRRVADVPLERAA